MNIRRIIQRLKWPMLFCTSYLFFLLYQLPAAVVLSFVPLPKMVAIEGVTGTLWQGTLNTIRWQQIELAHVGWSFQWWSLLAGKPAVTLTVDDAQALHGNLTLAYRGDWFVSDTKLDASMPYWLAKTGQPIPVGVSGDLSVTIDALRVDPQGCQLLKGSAIWYQGQVSSPFGNVQLGSPAIELSCDAQKFAFSARQDSAALSSQSSFSLAMNGQYEFQSLLTPESALPSAIANLLKSNATDMGNGVYKIMEQGQL